MTTRHPTARRTHRPQPTSDDLFVEKVLETTVWARSHRRALIAGSIALVVLLTSALWYRSYRAQRTDRAATELTQIRQTLLTGNDALAIRDLETFLDRYGGTPSEPEARLMLGQALLNTSQPQRAIEVVEPQAGNLRRPLGPAAAFLLADAYESATQLDRAEAVHLNIAERAPFLYQQQRALDAAARLRIERGDDTGAVQLYDRLLALLPADNPDRMVYEMRRAEARARAGAGAPAG